MQESELAQFVIRLRFRTMVVAHQSGEEFRYLRFQIEDLKILNLQFEI